MLSVVGIDLNAPNGASNAPILLNEVLLPLGNGNVAVPGANANFLTNPQNPLDIFGLNLIGGDDIDYIFTGEGNDSIFGLDGADRLSGGGGDDTLVGGLGDDMIFGARGNDILEGDDIGNNSGFDTANYFNLDVISVNIGPSLTVSKQGSVIDFLGGTITTDFGIDFLFNIEQIIGTNGNDNFNFVGISAGLTLDGGLGFDTADYSQLQAFVTATISTNSVTVIRTADSGPIGTDVLTNFEAITGTAQADSFIIDSFLPFTTLTINGTPTPLTNPLQLTVEASGGRIESAVQITAAASAFANTTGNEDSITLSQDLIDAGARVTYLSDTGEGVIWLETNGVTQTLTYTGIFNEPVQSDFFAGLTDGAHVGLNDTGGVLLDFSGSTQAIDSSVLNAIPLFNLVDDFIGSNLGDTIDLGLTGLTDFTGGDAGDDVTGTQVSNLLLGEGGDDILNGLAGDDTLLGGVGNDNLRGEAGDDILGGGSDNDILDGGNGEDILDGGLGDDTIFGGGGNDSIDGDQGSDNISAGIGDDVVNGSEGDDTILGQGGADTLYGDGGADTLRGGTGNDMLFGGEGNDFLSGAGGSDQLFGGDGNDVLNGSVGADRLDGGAGNDILNGGADGARDIFVFAEGYDEDRINSFDQAGTDRLELDDALWAGAGTLTAQEVVDMFGSLNATGTILTLDFGNGDILEIQNGAGIDMDTFGEDILVI